MANEMYEALTLARQMENNEKERKVFAAQRKREKENATKEKAAAEKEQMDKAKAHLKRMNTNQQARRRVQGGEARAHG